MGHRLPDTKRIADGDDKIADFERIRIAKFEHRKVFTALELQHGKIGPWVAQHNLSVKFAPVGERNLHLRHVRDHMIIGDDET